MLSYLAIFALILALPVGYFLYARRKRSLTHTSLPQTSQVDGQKEYTLEELSQYNGVKKPQIYISVKNIVFDVTSSRIAKYQPGASYAMFAGKEISVALAKMGFEEEYFNCYQKVKLTKDEMGTLEGWFNYMKERYPIIGQIKVSKRDD